MTLPLPRWLSRPSTLAAIAMVHLYLGGGHLLELLGGSVEWTHIWKGFGALAGAYVFAALALRGPVGRLGGASELVPSGD